MYTGLYVQVSGQKRASDHLELELQIVCLVFKKDLIIFILNVLLLLINSSEFLFDLHRDSLSCLCCAPAC